MTETGLCEPGADHRPVVVVIDDHDGQRRAVCRLLGGEDYLLVDAGDGVAGLELARLHRPELVLLDVEMPGMDGYAVCRRLRADPLTAETVVVMMTALADQESRQSGLAAGADDFLTKPVDGLELKTRVANIVRLSRYRRLLRERAKFEWIAETADTGCLILSATNEITYANGRAREYLGLPAEACGGDFLPGVTGAYLLRPEAAWANWPLAGDSPRYLLRPETATQRALWLEVKVKPLPEGGGQERLVQISDVTGRMEERRLRATFELHVSHKLRTPLTALSGGLALLEKSGADSARENTAALIDMVRRSGRRLQDSITEILEYLDAPVRAKGGQALTGGEAAALARGVAAELGLADAVIAGELGPARLALSRAALDTVLRELFANARKFHPQHTPRVAVTLTAADGAARLTVSDDGPGLPVEELDRVLTPYYQYEKHETGEIAGMGLGLGLVAALVWHVGGDIRLRRGAGGSGLSAELTIPLEK